MGGQERIKEIIRGQKTKILMRKRCAERVKSVERERERERERAVSYTHLDVYKRQTQSRSFLYGF